MRRLLDERDFPVAEMRYFASARSAGTTLPWKGTDVVVEIFDRLIDMPKGERPLRTIAGLDFGFQALNDVTDPIRKAGLESMGVADWDGPNAG